MSNKIQHVASWPMAGLVTWASKISALGATPWATDVMLMSRGWRTLPSRMKIIFDIILFFTVRRLDASDVQIRIQLVSNAPWAAKQKCLTGGIFAHIWRMHTLGCGRRKTAEALVLWCGAPRSQALARPVRFHVLCIDW